MKLQKICILGGTGFVGQRLAACLADGDRSICIPSRHPQRHRSLLVHPNLRLQQADIHDLEELIPLFKGMDAVINLVGILNEGQRPQHRFQTVHVDLPAKVVHACNEVGVHRLLHMSALQADAKKGPSKYLFSKGRGENLVFEKATDKLAVTCFRPSVIFSPDDHFLNRFASLLKIAPFFFPLACPEARFAPVYVNDITRAFANALDDQRSHGMRYDLCGPEVYTLTQIVKLVRNELGLQRKIMGLGTGLSKFQARILEWIPGKPLTRDNLLSLKVASVCQKNQLPLLGIQPTPLSGVIKQCLSSTPHRANYGSYRSLARR